MVTIQSKKDITDILEMPFCIFKGSIVSQAKKVHFECNENALNAVAMLAFSNVCKNQCTYCGMRAGNTAVKRYRIDEDTVVKSAKNAYDLGFRRIFLISGEDPKYGFENLISMIERIKSLGFSISCACGEFSKDQYRVLNEAGVDEYVLKFETSNKETFNRIKPSTDFDKRMKCIEWIKEIGMLLASGNIVDYPGQTIDDLAEDILLMKKLDISWAPVIPYLPVANTPLAGEGGRGSLEKLLKEIAILRIMMPKIHITAQQPGENVKNGLTDKQGNLNALEAGANMLFADMFPDAVVKNFNVVDNRTTLGLEHIRNMADKSRMKLVF